MMARRAAAGRALALLLFVAGLAVMLQNMLPDPLDRSFGDKGDGLVLIATLEHWWRVLGGDPVGGTWRQAGFFYPVANPIGLTDSYLGLAIPYCLLRLCSVSPYRAFTAAMVVFATLGYWTAYRFCRATGFANRMAAALSAWVFAFGAVTLFLAGHAQTYTIMLAPTLGLCLLAAWRAQLWSRRALWGLLAGLTYGLILLTAPQTAWFGTFVGGLAFLFYVAFRRPDPRTAPWALPQAAGFASGAAIGLAATVFVNRPGQGPIQQRNIEEIRYYLPTLSDMVHQPAIELLWNGIAHRFGLLADPSRPIYEVYLGYGPILLLTLLIGCGIVLLRGREGGRYRAPDATALACTAAALLCGLLQVPFGRHSFWLHRIALVPGAGLIRTPFRIQDACLMFAALALACLLTRLAASKLRLGAPLAAVLAVLLLAEQVSLGLGTRQTSSVTGWFARVGRPPAACQSFYVTPGAGPPAPWYEYQSEAMMLAQEIGLPTLNGNSSWYPPGWEPMRDATAPGYPAAVAAWIAQNRLRDVCQLDASSAQWTLEPNRPPA